MKLFFAYLKEHVRLIAAFVIAAVIFAVSFALYELPLSAVAYPAALCLVPALVFAIIDFYRVKRRHAEFLSLTEITAAEEKLLPPVRSIDDADYRRIIALLADSREEISRASHRRWSDMIDYYTVWVHQIKTPIASMRLTLQSSDSPQSRRLSSDLGRIEHYVEMALVYLRLDSESSDYVIREFELDPLIRRSVKKFAGDFITKHLSLELMPTEARVISDEKWLAFVIEQILSNSLKYTREGSVRIYMTAQRPSASAIPASALRPMICRASSKRATPAARAAAICVQAASACICAAACAISWGTAYPPSPLRMKARRYALT